MAAFAAVTQWTILLLLVLAGINFLRLYLVLVRGRFRAVTRDDEFRLYLAFLAAGSILLLVELLAGNLADGEQAVREAVFQAVSIMTTAGFATADYTEWSALAELTLLVLMFLGVLPDRREGRSRSSVTCSCSASSGGSWSRRSTVR